jgi:hypothetical protein
MCKQHKPWLKDLFQAVFKTHDFVGTKPGLEFVGFPVSFAVNYEEGCIGEAIINGLTSSWYVGGEAVSVGDPGMSTASALLTEQTFVAGQALWELALSFRYHGARFVGNMKQDEERLDEFEDLPLLCDDHVVQMNTDKLVELAEKVRE